jgi:hypothetical protein
VTSEPALPDRLRQVAVTATVLGAIGSLVQMFLVGRRNQSSFLMVLFAGWVTLPFLALGLADHVSKGWSAVARTTLHVLMIALPTASLILYAGVLVRTQQAPGAFRFLVVPLASWAAIAIAIPLVSWLSRRSSELAAPSDRS